ncbi:MAG: hypothetical protein ACSLFO_10365 [Acidimicrobiales bacterium]
MLNTPGQDDHDGDLELSFGTLDGGDERDGGDDLDDCPPLDDSLEQVGYELYAWDPTQLDELDDALHELGLPHEWVSDGYEVVVHEADEARLDALLPTIRFPDEIPAEVDDGDDTDVEVLSALFVAADRMQRDPTGEAVAAFLDAAERIGDHPPYGIDEAEWKRVVEVVDEIIDLFHAAAPTGQISAEATRLRSRLRPLV